MSVDLSKIEALYSDNIRKFGIDSRSVGWNSNEGQYLRFGKLLKMIDRSASFTLNELGCGYGELVKYMADEGYRCTSYFGADISEEMLAAAASYLKGYNNVELAKSDKLQKEADYSTTSGIFNVMFGADTADWEKYIFGVLRNLHDHSRIGFSFNLLTKYVDFKAENLYYADPAIYLDFCKKELNCNVVLYHDYNLYEWTLTACKK